MTEHGKDASQRAELKERNTLTVWSKRNLDISFGFVPGSPSGTLAPSRWNKSVQNCGIVPSAARKRIGFAGKMRVLSA